MSDFEFAVPEVGSSVEHTPRVLIAKFGDGYEQRVPDGINTELQKWTVKFIVDVPTGQAIHNFLKSLGGSTSFTWTPPNETEIRVVCRSWRRTIGAVHWEINTTFEEVPI